MTTACSASASARARSPAPSARLIAEETRAAHRSGRQHLHQHDQRKDQGEGRERRGSEDADVNGLEDRHQRDHQHGREVGQGEPQQGRQDRARDEGISAAFSARASGEASLAAAGIAPMPAEAPVTSAILFVSVALMFRLLCRSTARGLWPRDPGLQMLVRRARQPSRHRRPISWLAHRHPRSKAERRRRWHGASLRRTHGRHRRPRRRLGEPSRRIKAAPTALTRSGDLDSLMTSVIASVPALESLRISTPLGAVSIQVSSERCGSQEPTPWAKAGEQHARTVPIAVAARNVRIAESLPSDCYVGLMQTLRRVHQPPSRRPRCGSPQRGWARIRGEAALPGVGGSGSLHDGHHISLHERFLRVGARR